MDLILAWIYSNVNRQRRETMTLFLVTLAIIFIVAWVGGLGFLVAGVIVLCCAFEYHEAQLKEQFVDHAIEYNKERICNEDNVN